MSSESSHLFALAGLLHDIGKFALRAGEGATRIWDEEGKRDYRYKHALLTADFVEKYVPAPWKTEVKLLAGNHHRPVRLDDCVIVLADHLSAGERAEAVDDEQPRVTHPQQLLSIFCDIRAEGTRPADQYLPLAELRLSRDSLFPGPSLSGGDAVWREYQKLWARFAAAVQTVHDAHTDRGDLAVYLENLLMVFQRFAWCVPSAYYRSRPDISLYDHSRMTAALAAVLPGAGLADAQLQALANSPNQANDEVALLVGGDVSGIQDFIYTITARGATAALRGRSFYLQLLTEACARYILRSLDLPITNLIYTGGGSFYLLARADDASRLTEAQQAISKILLQHHRGATYLALSQYRLRAKDFYEGGISRAWQQLTEGFQEAKQQRFSDLGPDMAWVFATKGAGGNEEGQCQVCGVEHPATEPDSDAVTADAPLGVRKCPACRRYEALGDSLRRARFLLLAEIDEVGSDLRSPSGGPDEVLAALGLQMRTYEALDDIPPESQGRRVLLALDDDSYAELRPSSGTAIGRRFIVNVTPALVAGEIGELRRRGYGEDLPRAGSVKPFSVLAEQSSGIKRLGVLRMDVDNLGRIFADGLGKNGTLSRVAGLSFAISLFFEGWVGKLAEEYAKRGPDRLYSIYSGGDDLFFVGAWDAVVELARDIRVDLTPYAAGHPGIHASAGIALIGGKYPLYQAARDAGAAETKAKGLQWWDADGEEHHKDAVCFLNRTLPWARFGLEPTCEPNMDTAHGLMHWLVEAARDGEGNRLIRRLNSLYTQYAEAEEQQRKAGGSINWSGKPQALWGPWMWRAFYTLSRLSKQVTADASSDVLSMRDRLQQDDFRSMEWIGLAARWAELNTRNGGE